MLYLFTLGFASVLFPCFLKRRNWQIVLNLLLSSASFGVILTLIISANSAVSHVSYSVPLSFAVNETSAYFTAFVCILWAVAQVYTCFYISHNYGQERLRRFLPFYNLAVFCTFLIAFSSNLFTTFIFYELLTIATLPLVGFGGGGIAKKSIMKYFFILSFTALLFFLPAIFMFQNVIGTVEFMEGGLVSTVFQNEIASQNQHYIPYMPSSVLMLILLILLIFGVAKSAIFPFNGWLPSAMCAPAPVSALLHAVAVVKSGAFVVYKIIYELYGVEYFAYLKSIFPQVFTIITLVAVLGIFVASFRAVFATDIKKILAFSTISNMTYIFLLFFLGTSNGMTAGFWHVVVHGITKITLFFIAGVLYSIFKTNDYRKMAGAFSQNKILAFSMTISCFALMGLPLTSGFLSKIFTLQTLIGEGAIISIIGVVFSTIATAIYFAKPLVFFNLRRKSTIVPSGVTAMLNVIILPLACFNLISFFGYFLFY